MNQSPQETIPDSSKAKLNPPVFYTASGLVIVLLLYAALMPKQADAFFGDLQTVLIDNGGWFYILTVAILLITVTFLGLSRYGDIKLGPDHAKPDYSKITWFSMLFSAGMGIGLMFFAFPLSPCKKTPEQDHRQAVLAWH